MGRPDFGRSTAYQTPPFPHALHDDNVDVVDGDVAKGLDDGLPIEHGVQPKPEPEVEPEPLFRWGIGGEYLWHGCLTHLVYSSYSKIS